MHRTKPLLRRTVPLPFAIAAGLFGVLIGFAMGIVITITKPDGSKVTLNVPDGSDIDIRDVPTDGGPADAVGPAAVGPAALDQMPAGAAESLVFAILVEPDDVDAEALQAAKQLLKESVRKHPVTTDFGTWYPVIGDFDVPVEAIHGDQRYTLVRHDREAMIGWDESRRHLAIGSGSGSDSPETALRLRFSEPLATRVRELTRSNLSRRLAIIVDGRVITAPRILSEISDQAQITGKFTAEDIRRLEMLKRTVFFDRSRAAEDTRPLTDLPAGPLNPLPSATSPATADGGRDSAAPAAGSEHDAEAVAELQGVWRLVPDTRGRTVGKPATTVMAFDERKYYVCDPDFVVGGGTFSVSHEGRHPSIDFHDQMIRDQNLPVMRAIYRFNADGRLEIHSNQAQPSDRPSSFAVSDPFPTLVVSVLERIGDLPRSPEEARALAEGQDQELSQALLTLVKALQVPPEKLTFPTPEQMGAVNKQKLSAGNLKRIGLAFHNFYAQFNKLPGSSNQSEGSRGDAAGQKIYPFSWRVALLPYLGEDELYQQYRFHEPWDSEHNRTLLSKMPLVYQSPLADSVEQVRPVGETHYQGFVGPQTGLGDSDGESFHAFTDGTSPTLLVVESQASVPWTQPQDLRFEKPEDAQRIQPFDGQPLNFVTADGAARTMDPVDHEKLAKLITRNGGEPVKP